MKASYLKQVQAAGWVIADTTETHVKVKCPARGCGVASMLKEGATVPKCDAAPWNTLDKPVSCFDDLRKVLRARREELGISIRETEEAAGLAVDYLAKFERENPSKIPNAEALIVWAQSLGFTLTLTPAPMPAVTLRTMESTRDLTPSRRRRFEQEKHRRFAQARQARGSR